MKSEIDHQENYQWYLSSAFAFNEATIYVW